MALTLRRQDDPPAHWDPFEEAERLHSQLARLLEGGVLPMLPGVAFIPPADVEETSDAYNIEIELPGVKREDVEVELTGGRLMVTGELKEKERVGILRRRARKVGRFQYEIQLPTTVDDNGVIAQLEHGVLTVRVPKSKADQPRRVKVV
jgi:HSP20 family protein